MATTTKTPKLSKEEVRAGNLYAFKVADEYQTMLDLLYRHKFSSECEDNACSKELKELLTNLRAEMKLKINRMIGLSKSVSAEISYLEKQGGTDLDYAFRTVRIMQNIIDSWLDEYRMYGSYMHRLDVVNVRKGSKMYKALKWSANKTYERYTGKSNPINLCIQDQVLRTPYSSYSTFLVLKGKDVWDDIYERTGLPTKKGQVVDKSKRDEGEEIRYQEIFEPVVDWCYTKKKLNFVERRNSFFSTADEKAKKNVADKKAGRRDATAHKKLDEFYEFHNRWYNQEVAYTPYGFLDVLDRASEMTTVYVLAGVSNTYEGGVSKWNTGYLCRSGSLSRKMADCLICPDKKTAENIRVEVLKYHPEMLFCEPLELTGHHRTVKEGEGA